MTEAQMELIRQGLQATDPKELKDQVHSYCTIAIKHMLCAYHRACSMLESRNPTEIDIGNIRYEFKRASENMLDAVAMFDPDCLIDLLNCED